MVLGRKEEPTDDHKFPDRTWAPTHRDGYFNQPTDIAWDAQGNMYISDGYVNSRVAKIDAHGNWIKSWGVRGSAPGQFNTPHNIGLDRQGPTQYLYTSDAYPGRVYKLTLDGKVVGMLGIGGPDTK